MKEITPNHVQLASINGKYFRMVIDPLTKANSGMKAILFIKLQEGEYSVKGIIISVMPEMIWFKPIDNPEQDFIINPSSVAGWTTPRLFAEDMANALLQSHPERFCKNFQKNGIKL